MEESHKGDQVTDALVIACVCSIHLLIGKISYHIITHTFICEMYTCNECFPKQSFSTLDDIGMHMRNEHGAYGSLSHFKRQLNNQEFFDETIHFASDLFRNKK